MIKRPFDINYYFMILYISFIIGMILIYNSMIVKY